MKSPFLAAILGGLLVAAVVLLIPTKQQKTEITETAFERVMRSGELRCGYFSWPPYVMRDPNTGQLSGINVDYLQAVADELGWKINWALEVGPGEAIEALNTNKVDMMCGTLWPDGARAKNLTLTNPSFYTAMFVFVRDGDTRFDGDLKKLDNAAVTFSVMDGDVTTSVAKATYPNAKTIAIPQNGDGAQLMTAVVTGKADAVMIGRAEVEHFNANNEQKLREVQGVSAAYVFGESYAMKTGEFQFKNAMDTIILRMNNNGYAQSLLNKYNMSGYYPVRPDYEN
jgi:ABC-type amino acid transport substrate-binding protein